MRRIAAIFVLVFGVALAQGGATDTKAINTEKEINQVKHETEIPYTGRPIMLMFDTATCPYCKKTRQDLVDDPFLRDVAKDFDLYNIPRDKPQAYKILGNDTTLQSLIMLYKVKVTPNIILLTSHGEKIWQLPGYAKPDVLGKIMVFVKGVDEGRFKKAEWKDYLKKNGLI